MRNKTESCGTPTVNGNGLDNEPSILTWNTLLLRYDNICFIAKFQKPYVDNLAITSSWSTVSKAFLKSRKSAITVEPLINEPLFNE